MLRISRNLLIKVTYLLIAGLLFTSVGFVIYSENPERLIQGEWQEKEWHLEKDNAEQQYMGVSILSQGLRAEILRGLEEFHHGVWKFDGNRVVHPVDGVVRDEMEWYIKGRGHILELRRDGKPLESFQIQRIDENSMVLHLNLDLQVKGVIKIVLERIDKEEYAKKV